MSFQDLKKRSTKDLTKLLEKIDESTQAKSYDDDRIWYPSLDKNGNGFAIIRFLPAAEGEDMPWVQVFSHSFKGKGGWYIENCPTTLGGKCPACEANSELWNSGVEDNKKIARDRKRKLNYYSNILVVSDPANRDNEGKVFLYRYGKKIFNKIIDSMKPQYEDEKPINPFDLWNGANLKLKIGKVEGYTNYDKSVFDAPSPVSDDDAKIEQIYKKLYKLTEFVDPSKFKPYEQLQSRLRSVLSGGGVNFTAADMEDVDFEEEIEQPISKQRSKSGPAKLNDGDLPKTTKSPTKDKSQEDDSDEDALAYFKTLSEN